MPYPAPQEYLLGEKALCISFLASFISSEKYITVSWGKPPPATPSPLSHPRLWFNQPSPWVRSFLTAREARSWPALCRSGVRSGLCLRACLAQSADGYAHTRTGPTSAARPGRGTSPAAV